MSIAMPELRMDRPLHRVGVDDRAAGLVREQVDGVGRVVPQQVVGPAARLAERVRVGAPEEVRLHVHLLDVELAGLHTAVDPLVARVEPAGVAAHRDETGALLGLDDAADRRRGCRTAGSRPRRACRPRGRRSICSACICVGVASTTASTSSSARLSARSVVTCSMPYLLGDLTGRLELCGPTTETTRTSSIWLHRVEVLDAEGSGSGEGDVDGHGGSLDSLRMRWPTAVLLAGTW